MHLHRSNKHDLEDCSEAEKQLLRQQLFDVVHHKLKMAAENSAGYGLDSLAIEISGEEESTPVFNAGENSSDELQHIPSLEDEEDNEDYGDESFT